MGARNSGRLARAVPAVFVVLWATGFVVARLIAPHADPLTFLTLRFGLSAALFAVLALAAGARWPRGRAAWGNQIGSGVLMQGIYVGGVFWAVRHGMPSGISALVTGLQPLLTAVLSFWLLGERVRAARWVGIAAGFLGIVMVLAPKLGGVDGLGWGPFAAMAVSVLGITLGTIWQKRAGVASDVRANLAVQFLGAGLLVGPASLLLEAGRFDDSWAVLAGLAWAVLGLSLGAGSLLLLMIRRGAVAGVASLMYLVPPVAAVMAYAWFGESLNALQIMGMAVAAGGVWLASRER